MCVLRMKPKVKTWRGREPAHLDSMDSSPCMRGLSPHTNGRLNSFYSAGPVLSLEGLIQTKLTIGQPNDRYEQEADRVADKVMSTPEPKGSLVQRQSTCPECPEKEEVQTKPIADQITPLVQRQEEAPDEEEEEAPIQAKFQSLQVPLLQRQEGEEEEEEEAPVQAKPLSSKPSQVTLGFQSQLQSIKSGGQPLPQSTRSFFEPRFGRDFSQVRVHVDTRAANAAKSINAKAFTTGEDIVLGPGQYSPETSSGKCLLAHELTHVMQQRNGMPNSSSIQRFVDVNPNISAANDILSQFRFLCPAVKFTRVGRSIIGDSSNASTKSCECVSDAAGDPNRTYTINVDNVTNSPRNVILYNGVRQRIPYPSSGPRTNNGTNPTIYIPASAGSAMEFGAFTSTGSAFWAPNWRILGHELCGHARLNQSYSGTKGRRPGHDVTIDTENTIAAEHGGGARGHFSDTRQGESFHNLSGASRVVFKLINGWHYEVP